MTTIGIDIGGTKIAAGSVDEAGTLLVHTRHATDATDPRAIEETVIAAVAELRTGRRVDGVIGAADLVHH